MKSIFKACLTIGFIMIISNCFSQIKVNGGSGGFYFGGKSYDTKAYNYFNLQGNQPFDDDLFTVGGGGYKIINNFMIGGYGFFRGGESRDISLGTPLNDFQNFNYTIAGGGGYITLGYVVYSSNRILVFPQLGIGGESLALTRSIDEDITIDNDEFTYAEYSWGSPMLDLGVGFDIFPFEKGFKLGVRAGYNLSLSEDNDWKHTGGDIVNNDLPENDLNGFYLHLVIGGGNFSKK